ncbi:MAG: MBL fold metallo-hydrolase [Eubacteriales bacterium]|nr:MBL fold metallo-hydrolase [Eubacteriales bacterium]
MGNYKIRQIDGATWQLEDPFHTYLYVIEGEREAVLFDAGNGFSGLSETIRTLTDKPVSVILSHGHFDHTGCAGEFEHGRVWISQRDEKLMREGFEREYREKEADFFCALYQVRMTERERADFAEVKAPARYSYLAEGDVFDPGERPLRVIETPGHTRGSICLLDERNRMLFSGDTVCNNEILVYFDHSATVEDVLASDEKLYGLRDRYDAIWPGHHSCPLGAEIIEDYETAARRILENPRIGERVELAEGHKLLYSYRTIGISYLPETVYRDDSR